MMRRLYPHPLLSLTLVIIWLLLVNQVTVGSLVFAIIAGTIIPKLTSHFWPNPPKLHNPLLAAEFFLIVLYDIVKSNLTVANLLLFKSSKDLQPGWVTVPIELRSPEAIAILAGTITMTPGTLTADMSADGRALLIHGLHMTDPEGTVQEIKERYEARLKRIFE